jgi:hypothetical protein
MLANEIINPSFMNFKAFVILISIGFLSFWENTFAQKYATVDIIKVKAKYEKEAMYFYTENWQAFRKKALTEKVISGYEFLKTETDTTEHFHLILITEYPDSLKFHNQEANFRPIMQSISPNGPKLLNDKPIKEIVQYLQGYDAVTLMDKRKKKNFKK